jgi:hypothetical protein
MIGVTALLRSRLLLPPWRLLVALGAFLRSQVAEILLVTAWLSGWALFTYGIALYTSSKVYPISAGLFLLSLVGWKMLWAIVSHGLYALSKGDKK